jgi:hypothetical protein
MAHLKQPNGKSLTKPIPPKAISVFARHTTAAPSHFSNTQSRNYQGLRAAPTPSRSTYHDPAFHLEIFFASFSTWPYRLIWIS